MTSMLDTLAPLDEGQFPTGRYAEATLRLQRELIDAGYLPALKSDGKTSSADGWMGPRTEAARRRREQDLANQPLPPKPFLATRRGRGLVKMAAGTVVGVAGFWWSGAEHVNAAALVDIGYQAWEYVSGALDTWARLLELAGLAMAAAGFGQHVKGALRATAPVALGGAAARPGAPGAGDPPARRVRGAVGRVPADADRPADGGDGFWAGRRGRDRFLG